jgi:hypothetical protein
VRSAVVIDRSHREILSVKGKDRLSWLHLVISQHVTELPAHTGTEALVLDSQGRVEAHMVLAHLDNAVWLDTDPGTLVTSALPNADKQSLHHYLLAMKFWSEVDIEDRTADFALLSLMGPETESILDKLEVELPHAPYAVSALDSSALNSGFARRMPWPLATSVDLMVPRAELTQWWKRLTEAGARPAGSWAFEALRAESLHARAGVDTDERAIPHEVNWIGSAAHVAKGCYRGQETVAKVHNVGRPPRLMVLLHLDGSPEITPETGDAVTVPGQADQANQAARKVGRVGTVVHHHELGPIALALVKRSALNGEELIAGEGDHAVQATVDPDSIPVEEPAPGREAARGLRGEKSSL